MANDLASFAGDIRPLFRTKDISSMERAGLDLSSYDEVSTRAEEILERLQSGTMPCDGAWPTGQVSLFEKWISDGKQP